MQRDYSKIKIEHTLKSADTEERIDIYFYRPIGYRFALLFARWGITPNAVTLLSICLGVAAGVLFYPTSLWYNVLGMFLLVCANLLDSVDGQLARLTNNFSTWGRILDGLAGDFWFITIYLALSFRLVADGAGISIFLLALLTAIFHTLQAAMADYYRNVHLFFIKGVERCELHRIVQLQRSYLAMSWHKNFWAKGVQALYINYTLMQQRMSPLLLQLRRMIVRMYNNRPPKWLIQAFRKESLPMLKYTNILSFNTRAIALFLSLFLGQVWLFFLFELLVLNPLLIYMIARYETISQHMILQIEQS